MIGGIFGLLFLLAVLKPVVPVFAGALLVGFVTLRAERDLNSPFARERWTAFKRLAVMVVFGFTFLGLGLCSDMSLPAQIAAATDAKHAIAVLGIYFSALIGVPGLVFIHTTRSRMIARRRVRVSRKIRTLSRLAAEGGRRMSRAAI